MFARLTLNWGTPFLALAIYGLVRYFVKADKKTEINWSPLESVGVTIFIYFAGQILGALIIYLLPLLSGVGQEKITNWIDKNVYGQFLLVLAVETISFMLVFYFIKRRNSNLKSIGLKKPKLTDPLYSLIGFGVYFALLTIALTAMSKFLPQVNQSQKQIIGFDGAHGGQLVLVFISLVILPPLVEEIMMRGFLYSGLKTGMKAIWAALITSALFATAHLQAGSGQKLLWSAAVDTFILSLVLVYLREKTGSLWASIGLHVLKNAAAFATLFVFHAF